MVPGVEGEEADHLNSPELRSTELDAAAADPVTACLSFLALRHDRPSSPVVLRAGLALDSDGRLPFHQAESALDQVGLRAEPWQGKIDRLKPNHLPAIVELADGGAAVLLETARGQFLTWSPGHEAPVWTDADSIAHAFTGQAILVEP